MVATSLELDSQTRKKRKRKEQQIINKNNKKLVAGDKVEVRSIDEGFGGSWHAATVIDSSTDLIRRVHYDHILDDKGIDLLTEDILVSHILDGVLPPNGIVPVTHRGVMRPLSPSFEFDCWGLNYGLCVDAYVQDAWWEGVIFDHEDGCDERLVFFPDVGDEQKVKIEHMRVTHDWDEVSEEWTMRGDWVFLELIEEHEVELFVCVSVRQLWYDLRAKDGFKTKIKEWTCWVRPEWDKLVLEVIRDNINLTATHFLTAMECEAVVKAIDFPSRKTRNSVYMYHTALPCEDILKDCVNKKNLIECSAGPRGRTRSSSRHKSDPALPCGDVLRDVDDNQVLKTRDTGCEEDTALESNGSVGACVNTNLVACSVGPGGRTRSSSSMYDFALPNGDILQDAENNCVLMTPIEEKSLKPNENSTSTLYETNNTNGSSELKLGSQVDKKASLRFRIVKDSNGCAVAVKGNLETLPINTNNGDLDSSHGFMENGTCDPKIVTLSEVDVDPNPIRASGQSDHNLCTQISSVTDDTGDQEGDFFLVAWNYLHKRGKQSIEVVKKHLSDMGWKIDEFHDNKNVKRVKFVSPEGQKYYSLIQVCKYFTGPKDNTRTQSSQIVNNSLMNSCIMSMDSSIQQVPSLDVLQQHCGRDGSTVRENAMALDHCKVETLLSRYVSPFSEPLARGSSSKKGKLAHAGPVVVEPENCFEAVVELYGLGPEPNQTKYAKELREKAKRHLSFKGWKFWHIKKQERHELRYTSPPPNSRDYISLRTACKECIFLESSMPVQGTMKDEESKGELACVNLSSAIVCTDVEEHPVSVYVQSGNSCTDIFGSSQSCGFQLSMVEPNRRKRTPMRRKKNAFPFAFNLGSDVSAIGSDTRPGSMSLAVSCSKRKRQTLCQYSNYQEQKKRKIVRAPMLKGDDLDGSCSSRMLRSHKRARHVVAPNPAHFTPRTILTWLIDNNVVLPREKVSYRRNDQSTFEGKITRDGIKCNCCHKVFGISSFEVHAGSTKRKPAANIFLEDGRSLLACQKQMIESGKLAGCTSVSYHRIKSIRRKIRNDSICSVCHYGGILVLCDQCPSSYHLNCIGLESLPKGKWFCPSCRCGICGESDYNGNVDQFTEKTVLYCDQCEREYHVGCLRKRGMPKLDSCPKGNWFCSKICEKIFLCLYKLCGKSIAVGIDNLSWTILKFSKDGYDKDAITVHSKLNVALAVMHECFEPIKEPQTKDLVKDVLFNKRSVLKRLDFQGFYTVLLEREDELISVATVRVYGGKVAEVPLVGTRVQYRRQGMCRILMDLLEQKLAEFGVNRLLLPAIPQVLHAWTTSFGFSKMTKSERLEYLEYTFLDFQDTTMCQKILKTVPAFEVKGPRAKQRHPKIALDLSNAHVSLDKVDVVPEVAKQNEPSDALIESPVKDPTCNGCSSHEMVSAVTTSSNVLWNEYEKCSTESADKQKKDGKCSKSKALLTYQRRKWKYRHRPQP